MADSLYLSIWFPQFSAADVLPRLLSVVRLFPFSVARTGITALAVHPVSWNEPTILERRFRPGTGPEQAVVMMSELVHDDYAYVLEAAWDLWSPAEETEDWVQQPQTVRFIAFGRDFEEGAFQHAGHIQVDFGLDTAFLFEELELDDANESRIRNNIQRLVAFTAAIEKNCGISGRVLWSESDENLAQKLITRLQKVQ